MNYKHLVCDDIIGSKSIRERASKDLIYFSKRCDPASWPDDTLDAMRYAGVSRHVYTKENNMNISADYEGKIKRIGNQFLLKLGCQEFICQTLGDVGKKVTAVLTEEYKKKEAPDEDE